MEKGPRKATLTRKILKIGLDKGYLTKDLALALYELKRAYDEGKIQANAATNEQAIQRTVIMMRGLENGRRLAEQWDYDWRLIGEETEPGFRARLSDEIAIAIRRGGLEMPDGENRKDVTKVVLDAVLELNPGIRNEVVAEINGSGVEVRL